MPSQPYLIKLLERIAFQTSGTRLEIDDYLKKVVGKPKFHRRKRGNGANDEGEHILHGEETTGD